MLISFFILLVTTALDCARTGINCGILIGGASGSQGRSPAKEDWQNGFPRQMFKKGIDHGGTKRAFGHEGTREDVLGNHARITTKLAVSGSGLYVLIVRNVPQ